MIYIGIDNGVTGSIAIISDLGVKVFPMPVKTEQSYTKKKQNVTRVDTDKLFSILESNTFPPMKILLERPMVNPMRFKATESALRALEATLIMLDKFKTSIHYFDYIDSKEWQKALLPQNMGKIIITKSGKEKRKVEPAELKKASLDIASRLFPSVDLSDAKDGDSLLIAEYLRRNK